LFCAADAHKKPNAQDNAVATVAQFTGTSANHARKVLAMPGVRWNVELACNHILETGVEVEISDDDDDDDDDDDNDAVVHVEPDKDKRGGAKAMFDTYRDAASDAMETDGLLSFCADLGVDPEDVVLIVLAFVMECKSAMRISRAEFMHGMRELRVSSMAQLKAALPSVRAHLNRPKTFKNVYAFVYSWSLEPGMKGLPKDVALAYWSLLLPFANFALLPEFTAFMRKREAGVSKDLWQQVLLFITTISALIPRVAG